MVSLFLITSHHREGTALQQLCRRARQNQAHNQGLRISMQLLQAALLWLISAISTLVRRHVGHPGSSPWLSNACCKAQLAAGLVLCGPNSLTELSSAAWRVTGRVEHSAVAVSP